MRNEYDDDELADMAAGQHEHGPWSHTDLLLADLWDLLAGIAHGLGGGKGQVPRYPRPGVAPPGGGRRGRMSRRQMDMYLANRKIGD